MSNLAELRENFGDSIESGIERFVDSLSVVAPLKEAIHYALFPKGKRIRPLFALAVAKDLGEVEERSLSALIALELVHASSLIHDDLPALDNDDYRRGQLSCHKKFGEATAILAGDLLIAAAFSQITSAPLAVEVKAEMTSILARAFVDVCHGQQRDLMSGEDRGELETLHRLKTGALFRAAAQFGLLTSTHDPKLLQLFGDLGQNLGVYFQIVDDLLDITGHEDQKGRPGGSDQRNHRDTFGVDSNAAMLEERKQFLDRAIENLFEQIEGKCEKKLTLVREIYAQIRGTV